MQTILAAAAADAGAGALDTATGDRPTAPAPIRKFRRVVICWPVGDDGGVT
jgi:hypothetical protein